MAEEKMCFERKVRKCTGHLLLTTPAQAPHLPYDSNNRKLRKCPGSNARSHGAQRARKTALLALGYIHWLLVPTLPPGSGGCPSSKESQTLSLVPLRGA